MKHFITFIAFIITLTLTSFTAQAQYAQPKPVGYVPIHSITQVQPITPASFLDLDGYKAAQSNIKSGKSYFWWGLSGVVLGPVTSFVLAPLVGDTHYEGVKDNGYYTYDSRNAAYPILTITGGILTLAGTICMIHGAWKWSFWEQESRNIRMAWYLTHNGIAIAF